MFDSNLTVYRVYLDDITSIKSSYLYLTLPSFDISIFVEIVSKITNNAT